MKILIIVLLFATSAFGQIYPVDPSLDSIRTYAYLELNIPTTGTGNVTNTKTNLKINLALGKLCTDFPAYQKIDTLYLGSDSDGVILPTDFTRMAEVFRVYDGMLIPMTRVPQDTLHKIFVTDSSGNSQDKSSYASPTYYRVYARKFFTHPVVSISDTFIIDYYATHPELTSGTDSVQFEPRFFDEFMTLVKSSISSLREQ